MSEKLFETDGSIIWYDLKSDKKNSANRIWYIVLQIDQKAFYVRPHREDGPALITTFGTEVYYIKGECHREDGPAKIWRTGHTEWWLNNYSYSFDEWCRMLDKPEEEINFLKLKYNN